MSDKPMMSPSQSSAARAWLEWSKEDLAERSNMSMSTVRDFEKGRRSPIANIEAMERTFVVAGSPETIMQQQTPETVRRRRAPLAYASQCRSLRRRPSFCTTHIPESTGWFGSLDQSVAQQISQTLQFNT